jgi:AraC-like DNA-binding protein
MPVTLPWSREARPRVILAGRYPLPATGRWQRYVHRGHEALHLHDYAGGWRVGDDEYPLEPGTMTLSPRGVTTEYFLTQPGHHLCIHFATDRHRGTRLALPVHLTLRGHHGLVRARVLDIVRMLERAKTAGQSSLWHETATLSLQALLLELSLLVPSPVEPAVERASRILSERFAEPLTVGEIADMVGLSQNYLAARFRRAFGTTVPHDRLKRRIEAARYLLVSTDLSVQAIGLQVGIADPQYFNKQFRRFSGTSPSALRRRKG